jgi:hypothetical protein
VGADSAAAAAKPVAAAHPSAPPERRLRAPDWLRAELRQGALPLAELPGAVPVGAEAEEARRPAHSLSLQARPSARPVVSPPVVSAPVVSRPVVSRGSCVPTACAADVRLAAWTAVWGPVPPSSRASSLGSSRPMHPWRDFRLASPELLAPEAAGSLWLVCFRYRLPNFPHSPACNGRERQRLG